MASAKKPAAKRKPAVKVIRSKRGQGPKNIMNKLYALLVKNLMNKFKYGPTTDLRLDMKAIAEEQDCTTEGIYKWFRTDTLPPERALKFIKMSNGKLKVTDFIPFVFKA